MTDLKIPPELEAMFVEYNESEAKMAHAIGMFSMRFAYLESMLNWANTILLNTTEGRGRVLMAAIQSVSIRLNVYYALVAGIKMEPYVRQRLMECGDEIGRLNTYRNQLLHNRWNGPSSEGWTKIWTETRDKKSRYKHKTFKPDEITVEAERCFSCVVRLMDGMKSYQTGQPLDKPC